MKRFPATQASPFVVKDGLGEGIELHTVRQDHSREEAHVYRQAAVEVQSGTNSDRPRLTICSRNLQQEQDIFRNDNSWGSQSAGREERCHFFSPDLADSERFSNA